MNILLYDDIHEPVTAAILNSTKLQRVFLTISMRDLLAYGSLQSADSGVVTSLVLSNDHIELKNLKSMVNRVKIQTLKSLILEQSSVSAYKEAYGLIAQIIAQCPNVSSAISSLGFGIDPLPLIEQWRLASYCGWAVPEYYYGPVSDLPFDSIGVSVASPDDLLAVIQDQESAGRKEAKERLYFHKPAGRIVSILVVGDRTFPLSEPEDIKLPEGLHEAAVAIAKSFGQQFAELFFSAWADRFIFLFYSSDLRLREFKPWITALIQRELEQEVYPNAL